MKSGFLLKEQAEQHLLPPSPPLLLSSSFLLALRPAALDGPLLRHVNTSTHPTDGLNLLPSKK